MKTSTDQISALQEDVDTHQSRIFELKDSLKKTESESKKKDTRLKKITAELKEAKDTILKLSANQQRATKAEPAAGKKESTGKPDSNPAAKSGLALGRRPYSSYKSIPEYAIQRGTPVGGQNNSMLSDDDIGWVD